MYVACCVTTAAGTRGGAYKKAPIKPGPKDLKPPDLWIHHEQMELKNMDKSGSNSDGTMVVSPIPRSGGDPDAKSTDDSAGMMDVRRISSHSKCGY